MSDFTSIETILIIYLLVSYILGVIMIITAYFASKKVSDIIFYIWFGVALPIALPICVYYIFDSRRKSRRKKDLENKFDEFFNNKGENDE